MCVRVCVCFALEIYEDYLYTCTYHFGLIRGLAEGMNIYADGTYMYVHVM